MTKEQIIMIRELFFLPDYYNDKDILDYFMDHCLIRFDKKSGSEALNNIVIFILLLD